MKLSFTMLAVLAGLAIANPVDTQAVDGLVERETLEELVQRDIIDPNCVSCIRRGCGKAAIKCLKGRLPQFVLPCLALSCGDDFIRCCT